MRGYNKVIIAGNLTRDAEMKYTVNRRARVFFTVAVNYRYKGQSGEYQEGTDYVGITAWGVTGENIAKYLTKGKAVLVEGKIRTGSYDKNGVKQYTTDVIADNIVLLSSGDASSGNYNSQPQSQTQARNNNPKDVYISPMPGGDFGGFNDDNFGGDFSRGFDDLNSGFGGFDPKNNDVNNNDDGDSESNLPF